jgi:hypothetical protein
MATSRSLMITANRPLAARKRGGGSVAPHAVIRTRREGKRVRRKNRHGDRRVDEVARCWRGGGRGSRPSTTPALPAARHTRPSREGCSSRKYSGSQKLPSNGSNEESGKPRTVASGLLLRIDAAAVRGDGGDCVSSFRGGRGQRNDCFFRAVCVWVERRFSVWTARAERAGSTCDLGWS